MEKHLAAGAKRVILSAPEKTGEVETVVYGVNKPEGSPRLINFLPVDFLDQLTRLQTRIGRGAARFEEFYKSGF